MTSKKSDDSINTILQELKSLNMKYSKSLNENEHNKELLNLCFAKLSDISVKLDFALNISSAKSKSITKSELDDGNKIKKTNILGYFKLKYRNDPASIKHIVSDKEAAKIFENSEEIKKKTKKDDISKAKEMLIYKYIKENDSKMVELRSMKEREESANIKVKPEIIENNIDDDNIDANTVDGTVDDNSDDDSDAN